MGEDGGVSKARCTPVFVYCFVITYVCGYANALSDRSNEWLLRPHREERAVVVSVLFFRTEERLPNWNADWQRPSCLEVCVLLLGRKQHYFFFRMYS